MNYNSKLNRGSLIAPSKNHKKRRNKYEMGRKEKIERKESVRNACW